MAVTYYTQETRFCLKERRRASRWIKSVVEEEGCKMGPISMIFCSDPYILAVNREHLKHDYLTDIITFDYCCGERIKQISGDLFISVDTVGENAKLFQTTFDQELHRVMIHGVLHLIGYGDKSKEEAKVMREKEDFYLKKYAEQH